MLRWTDTRDIFLTAALRAREARGLTRDILDRLLRARTEDEAARALSGTMYDDPDGRSEDIRTRLDRRRSDLYAFVTAHTAWDDLPRLIALPHDIHNLKIALKDALFDADNSDLMVPWGVLPPHVLSDVVRREAYGELPGPLADAAVRAIEDYFTHRQPALPDLVLDRAMHEAALSFCTALKQPVLYGYWTRRVDLANIRAFARRDRFDHPALLSRLFMPGGRLPPARFLSACSDPDPLIGEIEKDPDYAALGAALRSHPRALLALEREEDRVLTAFLDPHRFDIAGVTAVYVHVCAVERELTLLGMIMAAITHFLPRETLTERLSVLAGETA
ncbi:hypothetical protein JCM14469_36820 [Desulfatiferula olefinivorans]